MHSFCLGGGLIDTQTLGSEQAQAARTRRSKKQRHPELLKNPWQWQSQKTRLTRVQSEPMTRCPAVSSGPAAVYTTESVSVAASLDVCAGLGFLERMQGGWRLTSAGRDRLHICIMLAGPPTPMQMGRPQFEDLETHTRTVLEHWLHLKKQGWTLHHRRSKKLKVPPPHYSAEGQKIAYIFGTVLSKYYFQTLVFAQDFFDLGMEAIPHTKNVTWYKKLFSDSGKPQLPPPDDDGHVDMDVELDEDMGAEPSVKRRRGQPRAEQQERLEEPVEANGDLLMHHDHEDDGEESELEEVWCCTATMRETGKKGTRNEQQ